MFPARGACRTGRDTLGPVYTVVLPRKQKPIFPPRCVISGGEPDGLASIGGAGTFQLLGFGIYLPLMSVAVVAPVRKKLMLEFRITSFFRRFGRVFGIILLIFLIVFGGIMIGHKLPLWAVILIAMAYSHLYAYFDLKRFPPPFRIHGTQKVVAYMFRDPEYAMEFTGLNGVMSEATLQRLAMKYGMDSNVT